MKPKKGDIVSLAMTGGGVTSYETHTIARVRGDKVWVRDLVAAFSVTTGERIERDLLGYKLRLHFDGGKLAKEHDR